MDKIQHVNNLQKFIDHYAKPESFAWWGEDYVDVTPAVCKAHHGDGKCLMRFQSTDTRPYEYLVRVDSSVACIDDDKMSLFVEEYIFDIIADEYGECECEDTCDCAFPILILQTGYRYKILAIE